MGTTDLVASTGDRTGDQLARNVIGSFDRALPGRVRGCYLRGSYATGTRTAGSDLDMFVVFRDGFRDRFEAQQAQQVSQECARGSPVLLEIVVVSEQQVRREDNHALALNLKHHTRLLHGTDIRPDLPELRVGAYVRSVLHTPYHTYRYPVQRRDLPALTYPLRHLDPDGPFFGFDQWQLPGPEGTQVRSTKLLVGTVGWTATALVALATGRYVPDKRAGVALYREHIADEWTGLVAGVHDRCRDQWHYRIPAAAGDRRTLRAMCDRALGFQNHFLARYRDFLHTELGSGIPDRQALAARRLDQIRYPGT